MDSGFCIMTTIEFGDQVAYIPLHMFSFRVMELVDLDLHHSTVKLEGESLETTVTGD